MAEVAECGGEENWYKRENPIKFSLIFLVNALNSIEIVEFDGWELYFIEH